jgi:hypothetical protein
MKRALAFAALLATFPTLYAAEDKPPERAADCIAKSHDAVGCFVEQATFRFMLCKVNVQLADAVGNAAPLSCSTAGDHDLSDFYAAALKKFAKNKPAQSMTKDYYALWRSSMSALVPGGDMPRIIWKSQAAKLEAELTQKGERLKLER